MTERFIGLFKQCKKKTVLTLLVSVIILLANGSAMIFTHSYFSSSPTLNSESSSEDLVHVEEQYLVEDVTYTTFYQNNEPLQGKMVHKTLYNVISLPSFTNNSNIREIITYILLKYYQNQQQITAF
jgi:flagellar basal body-associated protein FliL